MLGETIRGGELTDPELALETLVWRLFNEEEEVRLLTETSMIKGCRCDPEHIRDVIGRFPVEERRDMAGDDGMISVDCAFCARVFPIPLETVTD
jgi:molecular chaperone Hsp33